MKDVVQFNDASKAAIEDAIHDGEDAEKRFKFRSTCVGGSIPRQTLHPSGKHHQSILSGSLQFLFPLN